MTSPRRKILIVDDAGPVVVLCVNILQALGYAVKGANRGEAALALLSKESFDLMIVDYKMPGLTGFEVFARALTIGPETMVMKFQPDEPMHQRYAVEHGFLSADVGSETVTIAQTVNAFFRWEFNSCEMLVKDGVVYPIDYANACPDVAVTSLHYYFPWAMKALLRWSVYCLATDRKPRTQVDTGPWFAVADDESLDYAGKLAAYQRLADDYFETERYREFCEGALPHVDEMVLEWVDSDDFRKLLTSTIQQTYPPHEWDRFEAHFGGLVGLWLSDEKSRVGVGRSAADETAVGGPAPAVPAEQATE